MKPPINADERRSGSKPEWTGLTGLTRFMKRGFNPVNLVNPVYSFF
jgi:hypothetical protein